MTKNDLEQLLEKFAIAVISTTMSGLSIEEQHSMIADGIEMVAETVIFCTDRSRSLNPSIN